MSLSRKQHVFSVLAIGTVGIVVIHYYICTTKSLCSKRWDDFAFKPKLQLWQPAEEWRDCFPGIDQLLKRIDDGEITWPVHISKTTDPKQFQVTVTKHNLTMGDKVQGFIQAKDYNGDIKSYGGDYLKARLLRLTQNGNQATIGGNDGIACNIFDHGNGTYSFESVSVWPGVSVLELELVHPSEAVVELVRQTSRKIPEHVSFCGTFPSGARTECNVYLESNIGSQCDFSKPQYGSDWFCYKPQNESCPDDLAWLERGGKSIQFFKRKQLFQAEKNFHAVANSTVVLNIKSNKNISNFDRCSAGYVKRSTPSGFYSGGLWFSLYCRNHIADLSSAGLCFQNKTVYFIGDSTMRQWYSRMVNVLLLNDTGENNTVAWAMPRKGRDDNRNITIFYKSHGYPLHNPGPPHSRPYIVETLRNIGNLDNVYVVLYLGAHFALYHPQVFNRRVRAIRKAVSDLMKRNRTVRIFIRSSIRFSGKKTLTFLPSEWLLYRTDAILKKELLSIPGVILLDTWDMTTAQPQKDVHANQKAIDSFISLFLSYIC